MRINKYLAECGVCSRRKSEALILDGRVSIDGKVVTSLAVDVDPEKCTGVVGRQDSSTHQQAHISEDEQTERLCLYYG